MTFLVETQEFVRFADARSYAQLRADELFRTVTMAMRDEHGTTVQSFAFNPTAAYGSAM